MTTSPRDPEGGRAGRGFGYEFDKIDPSPDAEYPEASPYWYSVPHSHTVLAVVRSVTTALALVDLLPDLLGDRRVQTVFTVMPRQRDANFERAVRRLIVDFGVREVPWDEAVGRRFDLIVTASYEGFLDELSGPTLILGHGAGFGKYLAVPPDGRIPVSGDPGSTTTMALSHSEQREYFAPEQHERARFVVIGDPWRDRLRASLRQAERYREAVGLRRDTRLIAVSSTWGEYSLIATNPDLLVRLLTELPIDAYRVAAILHPNVWFGHSTWQVRSWLRDAIDGGLILVPPRDAWRGVLVAAHALVGDHGSVMLHAAGIEKPVCFGAAPNDELIAGGPSAELEARVPRLDTSERLRPQIDDLLANHDPAEHRATMSRVFEHPGTSHAILRATMYELMGLEEPATPPRVLGVDLPEVVAEPVTAHRVHPTVDADGALSVERFPAVLAAGKAPPP
ncbi:MAG TPA: hypothetical protein VJT75_05880, partial [Thermoleophilaceae bacterium]|nr:hypothetical protein [Thermoleophilaceae bacterium]